MTKNDVKKILDQYPTLCREGFGVGSPRSPEPEKRLAEARAAMLTDDAIRHCTAAESWLSKCERREKFSSHDSSSYGLKHDIENIIGYVTNGEFIVAAIHVGLKVRQFPKDINAQIAVDLSTALNNAVRSVADRLEDDPDHPGATVTFRDLFYRRMYESAYPKPDTYGYKPPADKWARRQVKNCPDIFSQFAQKGESK